MPAPVPEPGRIPVPLRLCRGCRHFVRIENEACDFCGADLAALEAAHDADMAELESLRDRLKAALAAVQSPDAEGRPDQHQGADRR